MAKYTEISKSEVPSGVRFDVMEANRGQIVEIAYGGPDQEKSEHTDGAPFKKITDRSVGPAGRYYRRVGEA